jgi:hypothetical protein
MVLAALEVERRRPPTEPTPIVLLTTTGSGGRRFPRLRPYRAHYRRRRSTNGIGS